MSTLINRIARAEREPWRGDLNIVFVGDAEIKKINRRFLGERGTTDVIAFRYPTLKKSEPDQVGGDIYICGPEAVRNARAFSVPIKSELVRLVAHGFLHLLGYDDHRKKDRDLMWKKQESYIQMRKSR